MRCTMRNPAKYTAGLGFLLPKKGGPNCFALSNKGGFDWDTIGDVFYFFVIKIEGFFAGMAAACLAPIFSGSLAPPRLL
jgi:hypothetical protein